VRSDLTILHQGPADGAGYWFVEADLEHILDADIAEKVSVGAGEHGPPTENVVGLEANIAGLSRGALPRDELWSGYVFLVVVALLVMMIHCLL
jgi:hypothetical protein